jgi:hypothetical protein
MKIIIFASLLWLGLATPVHFPTGLNDNTKLVSYKVFGNLEVGIPEVALRDGKKQEMAEDMGFVHFESADTLIQIKLRKKENEALPLSMIKGLTDEMATGFYKGTILQSEILTVNGIEFFVSDIRGHWNGEEEVIGMFRYYFNAGSDSYNLLMRYPEKDIEKTKKLKYRMLESVKWGK